MDPTEGMSIGQIGHHIGLHVSVNMEGKTVGGAIVDGEQWMPGVVVGLSALGDFVTILLDEPPGGTERHGLFHHGSGQTRVGIDDPARIRVLTLDDVAPGGVPEEIVELVRAGKMQQAIKQYRALNGATLDEARAALARV